MSSQPVQLGTRKPLKAAERARLVRRAKLLAWLGIGWHGVEAAVAVGAGLVAGSIALIGFGADSLIESVAGIVLLWRFAPSRAASESAERRAQKLIGASFYLLAVYVAFEAFRTILVVEPPEASWVGIGLAVVTLLTMPPLAIAKARIGERDSAPQRQGAKAGRTCSARTSRLRCSWASARTRSSASGGPTRSRPSSLRACRRQRRPGSVAGRNVRLLRSW